MAPQVSFDVGVQTIHFISYFSLAVSVPELTWTTEESMKMGALDKIDQPGGLGWPGNMRLGTGSQLVGKRDPDQEED